MNGNGTRPPKVVYDADNRPMTDLGDLPWRQAIHRQWPQMRLLIAKMPHTFSTVGPNGERFYGREGDGLCCDATGFLFPVKASYLRSAYRFPESNAQEG